MEVDKSVVEELRAAIATTPQAPRSARGASLLGHGVHWILGLAGAAVLLVGYEHLQANGQATPAYACLAGAGLLALSPLKALLHRLFLLDRGVMHLAHLLGALALVALPVTGIVSGTPVLTHAALAPFAMMGAAQALMHSNQPRTATQAAALRDFASSLPQIEQFSRSRDFTSPANVARAARVLGDLLSKAEALGETELASDPGFQAALRRVGVRTGLDLGLDAIQHSIDAMAGSPAGARAAPALMARLAQARRSIGGRADPATASKGKS